LSGIISWQREGKGRDIILEDCSGFVFIRNSIRELGNPPINTPPVNGLTINWRLSG
jgi:hypothetical protein